MADYVLVIPEALFTKKMPSYGCRNIYYSPKTIWQPSQVYNGNPYMNKTVFVFLVNRGGPEYFQA